MEFGIELMRTICLFQSGIYIWGMCVRVGSLLLFLAANCAVVDNMEHCQKHICHVILHPFFFYWNITSNTVFSSSFFNASFSSYFFFLFFFSTISFEKFRSRVMRKIIYIYIHTHTLVVCVSEFYFIKFCQIWPLFDYNIIQISICD